MVASYPGSVWTPPTVVSGTSRAPGTTGPAEAYEAAAAEIVAIETNLEAGLAAIPYVQGLIGGGWTDNYATLAAAVAAAHAAGIQFLYLPAGSFALSAELSLPQGVILVGNGSAQSTESEAATILVTTYGANIRSIVHLAGDNAGLVNLTIDGYQNAPTLQEAIYLEGATPYLDNIFVQANNATAAVVNSLSRCSQANLDRITINQQGTTPAGLIINGTDWVIGPLCRFDGTVVVGSGGAGTTFSTAHFVSFGLPNLDISAPCMFMGTYIDSGGGAGQIVHRSGQAVFTGCRFFQNATTNIPLVHELSSTDSVTIIGGYVYANVSAAANAWTFLVDSPNTYTEVLGLGIQAGAIQVTGSIPNLWSTGTPGLAAGITYAGVTTIGFGAALLGPYPGLSSNILAQTVPGAACGVNPAFTATSGQPFLQGVYLYAGQVVGHLAFQVWSTPAITPTHWWMALLNSSLVQVANTADQLTAALGAYQVNKLAIAAVAAGAASTFIVPTTGLYYVALVIVAATCPNIAGAAVALSNIGGLSATTGLTGPHIYPFTYGAITLGNPAMFAEVAQ